MRHKKLNDIGSIAKDYRTVNKYRKLSIGIKRKVKYGLSIAGLAATAGIICLSQSFSGVSSALSISSLSQTSGSINGGNTLTIKGEGFTKQKKIKQFAHNGIDVVALSEDDHVYIWGDAAAIYTPNNEGITYPNDQCTPDRLEQCAYYLSPVDITDQFGGDTVDKLYATSVNSFFATTSNGHIWAWGQNYSGQLATGDTTWSRKPINITDKFDSRIRQLYVGSTMVAITDRGSVYTWGSDYYGVDGRTGDNKTPATINNQLKDNEQIASACSGDCGLIITTTKGRVLVAGANNSNRYGNLVPSWGSQNTLTDISSYFANGKIMSTAASWDSTYFIDENGRLYSLGNPTSLGLTADDKAPNTPIELNSLFDNATIRHIHVGNGYYVAETSDGRYLAWGDNTYGQYGISTSSTTTANPVDVTTAWKNSGLQTDSSSRATMALATNGSIIGAGNNDWYLLNTNDSKASVFNPTNVSNRITQLNYGDITAIRFGINKANYTIKDSNTIEVTVPAHAAGKVDVTITDSEGHKTVLKDGYEYIDKTSSPEPKPATNSVDSKPTIAAPNTGI